MKISDPMTPGQYRAIRRKLAATWNALNDATTVAGFFPRLRLTNAMEALDGADEALLTLVCKQCDNNGHLPGTSTVCSHSNGGEDEEDDE